MSELDDKEKEAMKTERLKHYARQIYALEMDVAALLSTGRTEGLAEADKKKADIIFLEKAYAAVKAMS